MDHFKALRLIALKEVAAEVSSADYALRKVFRWYSKEFHTPLHQVDEIPIDDILRHYYEYNFEQLADSSSQGWRDALTEMGSTPEEIAALRAKVEKEAIADEAYLAEVEAEAEAEAKKSRQPKPEPEPEPEPDIKMSFLDFE